MRRGERHDVEKRGPRDLVRKRGFGVVCFFGKIDPFCYLAITPTVVVLSPFQSPATGI